MQEISLKNKKYHKNTYFCLRIKYIKKQKIII